jgi:hypothetical protein
VSNVAAHGDVPSAAIPDKAWVPWVGRVVSALPVLALALSASMKLSHQPKVIDMFVGKFGYREGDLTTIAILELACALVYAVPKTSVLGAVLVTAYLGGAVATHVRVSDVFLTPLVLGVLVWIGLWLREPRLRKLAPLRTTS